MRNTANWLGPVPGSHLVVAGGCGGIGRAVVRSALEHGLFVTVLDLPASIAETPLAEGVEYIPFDAADEDSIAKACAKVGLRRDRVDGFVFLCGYPILPRRPLSEVALSDWDTLMAVNLRAAYLLANGLLPYLRRSEGAAIVTVASSLGYQVMPGMGAYAASKGGLVSLTKAIAMELAPGVRANVVAPGAVDTDFLGGGIGQPGERAGREWFDQIAATYVSSIPLRRVAEPGDIADPILFLAGPGSRYMTGQVLHLNGGRLTP